MSSLFKVLSTIALGSSLILAACEAPQSDASWTLNPEQSGMTYITIKNGNLPEINTFRSLSGTVSSDGKAEFTIDLNSVDTNNETRDGRMTSILFKTDEFPNATVSANIDMLPYETLETGDSYTELLKMSLDLSGVIWEHEVYVLVTRLGENKVVVTNKAPLLLDAADFGYNEGLAALQKLAGLNAITPVVPVTVSLVYER